MTARVRGGFLSGGVRGTARPFRRLARASALISFLMAFAAACSSPAASPTVQPAKPTSPPAAAASPAASPGAAVSPAAAASPGAAPGAASSPAAQARPEGTTPPSVLSAPKPAERKNITYGATGLSWNLVPEIIAEEKGFFESENLGVETVLAGQSAAVCQQLLAKAVQIGGCSLNDMMQAVESSGAPLVLVANETITALQYGLMSKPSITSWADLKGKQIIIAGPKDNTLFYVRTMARPNGLQDNDYDFQFAGSSGQRLAALKSGAVDAALLSAPFDTQAEEGGFNRLDSLLPKYLTADNYAGGGPIVLKDWGRDHQDEVTRYIRAILKSVNWIYNPANKQEMFSIVGPKLNLTMDAFNEIYGNTVVNGKQWSADGQIRDSAVEGVVRSLVEIGSLSAPGPQASKFYDTTYLDMVIKGGSR
ncbi:MAG TPA: ABC transporter substrate-binding protein [Chloroflexota bacterium]|jgi:NitT/TauT family transport system substrate-binding protein|nr:ABC transporter substrate-binding protein [Chloroflexota bacterium]